MATIDENQNFAGTEFFPFNDSDPFAGIFLQTYNSNGAITSVSTSRGYDTSLIDRFRQGVEIRTSRHVYESVQGKIWAGNLNHFVLVRTIGQARSFTEFENTPIFDDNTRKFDPVLYIEAQLYDVQYPYPIIFNNGPQQEEEASIEPLTIQFRKANNEGRYPARSVKASLEDGNNFDSEELASSRVQQFIDFTPPNEARFFLDEGQQYIGTDVTSSIIIEGFTPFIQREIIPYDETRDERIVNRIQTADPAFISVLKALNFDLDGDIREEFDKKSATAGNDVYGPDAALAGTDSIAFVGRIRGA